MFPEVCTQRMVRTVLLSVVLFAPAALAQRDAGVDDVVAPEVLEAPRVGLPAGTLAPGERADVALNVTVDVDGRVSAVDPETLDAGVASLVDAACEAVRPLRFRPATRGGEPVAVVIRYVVRFEAPAPDAGPPRAVLSGRVFSKGTRDPVPLAFVSAADGGHAETDADGRFELAVLAGEWDVSVTASRHEPATFHETLAPQQRVDVVYRLTRNHLQPYETVVRDTKDRVEQARVELSGAELREVAGTQGEPLRVVMVLPGVSSLMSGLSYPVVRGAVPAATGFFLDGVQVPQLYHLLLGPSVVSPDFIERVDFFASNAPARFGHVTAGVVSATVAKPRDDRVHLAGYVDLLNVGAFAEVPIPQTGTVITAAGRVSYTGWLASLVGRAVSPTVTPVADFYDYQLKVDQKLGRAQLRLLAMGSSDLVGARDGELHATSGFVTSRFHRVDARALVPWGPGTLELGATLGVETAGLYSERDAQQTGTFLFERFTASGRARYRVDFERWHLAAGLDAERQGTSTQLEAEGLDSPFNRPAVGAMVGGFVEVGFTRGPLQLVGGLRVDQYRLLPDVVRWGVDPRLEARVRLSDTWRVRASVGLYHQAPMLLVSLPVSDLAALRDGLHEVLQASAGVEWQLPGGFVLSVEGYYNQLFQARERSLSQWIGQGTLDDELAATRWGRAYGGELMLRAPQAGRLFGWLTYSLMRSERLRRFGDFAPGSTDVTRVDAMLPFAFDQTHVANLVVGYQLPRGWKVSGTLHVNSGRPENGDFGSRTLAPADAGGKRVWAPVSLGQVDRLPAFVRLDARVSKTFLYDEHSLELYLDVFNITARQETLTFDYGYDPVTGALTKTPQGIPLLFPSLGLKGAW